MIKRFAQTFAMLLLVLTCGCNGFKSWFAQEFKQGEVVSGIARLSAQHLSIMSLELNKRFKNAKLPTKIIKAVDHYELGKGTVIRTLEGIDLDFPEEKVIYKDCNGKEMVWQGRIHVVKAEQIMYGRLTHNANNPVVPDARGIKMRVHVRPEGSRIRSTAKKAYIEFNQGDIYFDMIPRLASSQTGALKGVRLAPTSNTRFENVVMKNVTGTLHSEQVTMPFTVDDSHYLMQIGAGDNGDENKIEGSMTAFENTRIIPADNNLLDPEYVALDFIKTYACWPELNGVVEYGKTRLEEKIAPGMAALSTLAIAKIAARFADDHHCGMASASFLHTTTVKGTAGDQGSLEASLPNSCTITFSNYRTEPDCFGIAHEIDGQAVVTSARKKTKGIVFSEQADFALAMTTYEANVNANGAAAIKDRPEPIFPTSMQPAIMEITADVSKLTIKEICVSQGSINHEHHCTQSNHEPIEFHLKEGTISARMIPVLGKGANPAKLESYTYCVVRNMPIANSELVMSSMSLSLKKGDNKFLMRTHGVFSAVSGKIGNRENELSGEVSIGKIRVPFLNGQDPLPLKPDYDRARFYDSFQHCKANEFTIPTSDSDCIF